MSYIYMGFKVKSAFTSTALSLVFVAGAVVNSSGVLTKNNNGLREGLMNKAVTNSEIVKDAFKISASEEKIKEPIEKYIGDIALGKELVKEDPETGYYVVGSGYFLSGLFHTRNLDDWKRAEIALRKCAELSKTNASPHVLLSEIYRRLKKYGRELEELNTAIKKEPKDPNLYLYRARALHQSGRKVEARIDEMTASILADQQKQN